MSDCTDVQECYEKRIAELEAKDKLRGEIHQKALERIAELEAQVVIDLNQIESWKSSSTRWSERVDELEAKIKKLQDEHLEFRCGVNRAMKEMKPR